TRRSGVTLLEVLVSIFVMGIGLLSLLALFPIGVLTMRQAIQDDRAASAGASATNIAKMVISPSKYDLWFNQADADPNKAGMLPPAVPDGPKYSFVLDFLGHRSFSGLNVDWVGGYSGLVRRLEYPNPNPKNNPKETPLYWQISPDDIAFEKT